MKIKIIPFFYVISLYSNMAEYYFTSAEKFKLEGDKYKAIVNYKTALKENPLYFLALFNLASLNISIGKKDKAINYYQRALFVNPNSPEANFNLGFLYNIKGLDSEALKHFNKAIKVNPEYAKAYLYKGRIFEKNKDFQEAIYNYSKAIKYNKNYFEAYLLLGIALNEQQRPKEAVDVLRKAVEIQPNNTQAKLQLANTLNIFDELDEALKIYKEIVEKEPNNIQALYNIAYTLKKKGSYDEAIEIYYKVLQLEPNYSQAHFGLGLAQLIKGNLEEGWLNYEWRDKRSNRKNNFLTHSKWDGKEDLQGKTIFLHAEQGLGDTFQFIRYAKLLKKYNPDKIIVEVQRPLVDIISLCDYIDQVIGYGDPLPEFDFHISIMSLPMILKTKLDNIPANIPYLKADNQLVEYWSEKLKNDKNFKIGLCWHGNPFYRTQFLRYEVAKKSTSLLKFYPLAKLEGISLYNLQKMSGEQELKRLPDDFKINIFNEDFDKTHGRFMDTAAVMKNLDLILTVDTSICHLAGGLGVPVWVILPYNADWRWLLDISYSPWYPTMKLFRQSRNGDWESVIENVINTLREKK